MPFGTGGRLNIASAVTQFMVDPEPPTVDLQMNPGIIIHGYVGQHYQVEWRDALDAEGPWQLLEDIPALPTEDHTVYDPTPVSGVGNRFYQAVLIP